MKKIYLNKVVSYSSAKLLLFVIFIATALYSCKKPTEGVNVIVDVTTLSKAPTLINFVNGNHSGSALPANFSVTIGGPDASLVQTDGGGTTFTAFNGVMPVSLVKAASPSASKPVIFTVYAAAPGFAPLSKTITLTKDTVSVQTISLSEYANPAPGTGSFSVSTNLAGGVAPLTNLSTASNSSNSKIATLTIPAGTQFKDESGNLINASTLQTSVVHSGLMNNVASVVNSPDMHAADAIGAKGNQIPGGVNFLSAGVLNISMQAGTTPVKSFSTPIQASIELATGQRNYSNGRLVTVGDTIPLWSQNEKTGQWKYEGIATVGLNASGNLAANFAVTHLSYWGVYWWYPYNYYYSYYPYYSYINYSLSTYNPYGTYYTYLFDPYGFIYSYYYYYPWYNYSYYYSYNYGYYNSYSYYGYYNYYPSYYYNPWQLTQTYYYGIYDYNYNRVGSSGYFSPSTYNYNKITVVTPPAPDYVKTDIFITGYCSGKSVTVYPAAWVYYYDVTDGTYSGSIYLTNGRATGSFVNGHTYYVTSFYAGRTYTSTNFKISKSNVTIPEANDFHASITYRSDINELFLVGGIKVNCN